MTKTAKKPLKVEIPGGSAIVTIQGPEGRDSQAQEFADYIRRTLETRQAVVIVLPPDEEWEFKLLGNFT